MRLLIRSVLTWLLGAVILAIAIAVVGEWFIEVAKDKGAYSNAGENWDSIMSAVSSFVTSPWVIYPVVGLAGIVVGLWADKWAGLFGPRPYGGKYPARLVFDFDPQTSKPRDLEMVGISTFYVLVQRSPSFLIINFNRPTGFKDVRVRALDNSTVRFDVVHSKDMLMIIKIETTIVPAGYIIECEDRDPKKPPKGVDYRSQ